MRNKLTLFLLALHQDQCGAMSATGLLMMGIGMIFLAVGFIVYPIIMTGTDALLAWEYSNLTTITDETFTGFTAIVGITPLLVLIGFVTAGVVVGFLGVKGHKAGKVFIIKPVSILMLGISVIFIAVGLIILPVVLDGVASGMSHQASQTDTQSGVTSENVTTGNVTLTQTLFNSDVAEVTSVSSNITETPVADNYTSPILYLTGLTINGTRTITTVYDYADTLTDYTGLYVVLQVTPLLVLISFLTGSVVSGFFGVKGLRG